MTAHIVVPAEFNLPAIAAAAGNADPEARRYADGVLYVDGVDQQALDAALAAYDHQAAAVAGARARKLAEINAAFESAAAALTAGYPESERLTWPAQQAEALAWLADNQAPTPYLDGLAAARGITPAEMRQLTLNQVQLFMAASQQIVGKRQRLRDAVQAVPAGAPDALDQIAAITWDEVA